MIAVTQKCNLYATQATCVADTNCKYELDATDPFSTKFPCTTADDTTFYDLIYQHYADVVTLTAACRAYDTESSCGAFTKCEWEAADDDTCSVSEYGTMSILQNHAHAIRGYTTSQTCEDVAEAECGLGDTAFVCQWLEASSGDEASCETTHTYRAQQFSCTCEGVKTAVPSVDYWSVTGETLISDFVDTYSSASTHDELVLLGAAFTAAMSVVASA
tara:strand:- start:4927 stop:5577 length:651 start_codon:yes stop_codon:yes gene_type:complete